MIWYYKSHFLDIAKRLNELRANPQELDLLFDLQITLCQRISYTEKKQVEYQDRCREIKRQLRTKSLERDSRSLKKSLSEYEKKRTECQWLQYIWRCFGDGIAFSYVSKWGIKPFYYDTKVPEPKQSSGHLSGKIGLGAEITFMLEAKSHGVPTVLTDITNTIRYGDVCFLDSDEPYVVEVKSGTTRSKRATRQIENIQAIHSYLQDEVTENLRGFGRVRRIASAVEENNYIDMVCPLIRGALEKGVHVVTPERGIRYIAIRLGSKIEPEIILSGMSKPNIYILNTAKDNGSWGIYYPFTLSINEPDLLYEFVRGNLFLLVATDMKVFAAVALEKGFIFEELEDPDYAFLLTGLNPEDNKPVTVKISREFAARTAFDFMSWEWILDNERAKMSTYKAMGSNENDA